MSGIHRFYAVVALVVLWTAALPAFAHAADTTPPVLTRLTLPAEVRTGPVAPVVSVTATITDDASGVRTGDGSTCPPGPSDATAVVLHSQATHLSYIALFERLKNDDYRANVVLPRYAPPGTLTVQSVLLRDCAGNSVHRETDELAAAGFPTTLTVFGLGDTEAPAVTGLGVAPASVDNTKGAQDVVVTASIHDDLSGVAAADWETTCGPFAGLTTAQVTAPSGEEHYALFVHRHDDVYDATLPLQPYDEIGTWTLTQVHVVDCAGNLRNLEPPKFLPTRSFTVTGVDDRTPPTVAELSIAPSLVDTRAAGADVIFKARLLDDRTGIAAGAGPCTDATSYVRLTAPSGRWESAAFVASGGDDFAATLSLPRFAEAGTWSVQVFVYDCALNLREVGPAELAAAGLPSSLVVLPPLYEFGGFLSPLAAGALAERNAGSGMAVKFRLGGAQGLSIFDAGFPQVQPIDCATRQPAGDAVPLSAVEWRFMDLTDGLYHYKWKSSPDWHDVCRRLILGFDDGSRYSADVHFG